MTKALEAKQDPFMALLDWRNCPSENTKRSPAESIFNRRTRTLMPTSEKLLQTSTCQRTRAALIESKQRQAKYYDRNAKPKPRPPQQVGQTVRFKVSDDTPEWEKGLIVERLPYRSYNIRLPDSTTRGRSSRHVRFSPEPPIVLEDFADDINQSQSPTSVKTTPANVAAQPPQPALRQTTHRVKTSCAPKPPPPVTTRSGRVIIPPARYR